MKKAILIFGMVALLTSYSNSHIYSVINKADTTISYSDNEIKKKWDAALGTFQFEVLKGRELTQIKMEIIEKIEASRHATEIVYISYDERIRIKILPENMIQGEFEKLELMRFVDSFE